MQLDNITAVDPWQKKKKMETREQINKETGWLAAHPEPVTMHRQVISERALAK